MKFAAPVASNMTEATEAASMIAATGERFTSFAAFCQPVKVPHRRIVLAIERPSPSVRSICGPSGVWSARTPPASVQPRRLIATSTGTIPALCCSLISSH